MNNRLDLNKMGLVEMNSAEMEQVDGGGLLGAIIGAIVGAAVYVFAGSASINGTDAASFGAYVLAGTIIGAASPI